MFRHLCSACEELVRTANGRSVPVYVFNQVSFLRSIHHLKKESKKY